MLYNTFDTGPEFGEGIVPVSDQEHLAGVDLGEPGLKQERQSLSVVTDCSPAVHTETQLNIATDTHPTGTRGLRLPASCVVMTPT